MKYIKFFDHINLKDIPHVGGKSASLGELTQLAHRTGINIPRGFATTSQAYWYFIAHNKFSQPIKKLLTEIKSSSDTSQITATNKKIRALIESGSIPEDLTQEIITAYHELDPKNTGFVAVRSSATAEDLPNASFAGQHESFLYIRGEKEVLYNWLKCTSSLFTPRAIVYRMLNNISPEKVALTVGIQHMIPAHTSGVAFTLDPEPGFRGVICINATYGLGESIVQGIINPDEYYVHKERLDAGFSPILTKTCGKKHTEIIHTARGLVTKKVPESQRNKFCLSDSLILELARQCLAIEKHYSAQHKHATPMDIEWVVTQDNKLYIVQARPETIHGGQEKTEYRVYALKKHNACPLLTGQAVGQKIGQGLVFVCDTITHAARMPTGAVLVTNMTNPDWVPIMKKAAAIVTNNGGRTCHAAIVSRELGIPAIVGTLTATKTLKNCKQVTADCSTGSIGTVYQGLLPVTQKTIAYDKLAKPPVPIMLNISTPTSAFSLAHLPIAGVGLARTEFIIAQHIQAHPLALLHRKKLPAVLQEKIKQLTSAYKSPKEFFIEVLAEQIATIAAAFWPKPVYVRFSDFKTNEYCDLIGGKCFEPHEDNPMLGKRGAFRYYTQPYQEAFALECAAIKRARTIKGFTNIQVMVPMIRTAHEAEIIQKLLKKQGLFAAKPRAQIIAMCEVPACALAIKNISAFVDGFSIGSNDLTQFTLAIDRDDPALARAFNEQDPAVRELIALAIKQAHARKKPIGICGQGPSDYPEFRAWLIAQKIDYISLNPDAIIPWLLSC